MMLERRETNKTTQWGVASGGQQPSHQSMQGS